MFTSYGIYNYVPPRPSERLCGEGLAVSIVPLLILVCVPGVPSLDISGSGSFNPWVFSSSVLVVTILIIVTDVEPMFRTVVGDLKPF